jgi:predicted ATP-dependent Lon-type protease
MQNRVHLGGALSGRDIEGVNKTVSALIKLLFPDPEMETAASLNYCLSFLLSVSSNDDTSLCCKSNEHRLKTTEDVDIIKNS